MCLAEVVFAHIVFNCTLVQAQILGQGMDLRLLLLDDGPVSDTFIFEELSLPSEQGDGLSRALNCPAGRLTR